MVRIVIQSIPGEEHRYSTAGDYWHDPDGTLQIRVSEMSDPRSMLLVALHELVEVILCDWREIPEQEITAFDIAHPELDEPGESIESPYHDEHVFAETIERLMAMELDRNWQDHEAAIAALFPED